MKQPKQKFIVLSILIALAALTRLMPHPPNFAPIGAMAIFGGVYFGKKSMAFLIPILALFISDVLLIKFINYEYTTLGTYFTSFGALMIYGSFILIVLLGFLIRSNANPVSLTFGALTASVIFFLLSNFGVWASSLAYPKDINGLMACYAIALPFFDNTILGDLFFTFVLFGVFEILKTRFPLLAKDVSIK